MPRNLETDWNRVGRSGDTVDGREISEDDIYQAAESYDPEFYTALIWPEHYRWYNLGKVTQLKAEKNNEGGADLFAKLSPNEYYQQHNSAGQKLFTSMELQPNFRESGKTYMWGLGATDSPASVATSEVRFSRVSAKDNTILFGQPLEVDMNNFSQSDEPPGWFKKFFNSTNKNQETDMKKEDADKLKKQFADLESKFNTLSAQIPPNEDGTSGDEVPDESKEFAKLSDTVAKLGEQFTALQKKVDGDNDGDDFASQMDELKTALSALTKEFKAAVGEQPGTEDGEETGGEEDMSKYA